MKILVTGAAGFLGSHLCERLINEGHMVFGVDNLYTGSMDNLATVINSDNFYFYQHDVCSGFAGFTHEKIDTIYNLACPASPVHYQKDPIYTWKTSVFGAYNILELARKQKEIFGHNPRIVQASTSEVYGDPLVHPQPEEYFGNVNPIGIRSCYDEGKRAAESLFFDYRRVHSLNTGVFRIFNTYGPRMAPDDGRVVSNFIMAALQDQDLEIYGEGAQTRSFCYVDDLIDGIIRFSDSQVSGPINLGNPGEFTIGELASIIVSKVGSGKVVHKDAVSDDPKQRKPIIASAKGILNWEPKVRLTDGLDKTIEYFRGKL